MGYFILLLTIIVYLIRPAEWITALYFNWNMLLNGLGILFLIATALSRESKFGYDRITFFLFWFFAAMIFSSIANGQFNTILEYIPRIMSTIVIFVLVQSSIKTERQIKNFILVIIFLILFICYQCYLQVTVGACWGGLEPLSRQLTSINPITGEISGSVIQVVWYGILHDPNDLGMLLIAFVPYILNKVFYQSVPYINKVFWLISVLVIGYTVILTNSRGSLLALFAGLAFFYIIKKRSLTGFVIAAILGFAILAIAPSRMGEVTSGDYSAMGRVYAWILALELFAMNPVFGVGPMHFLDYHYLTTHNSYVLAFVENGILGLIGFLSVFVLSVYSGIKVAFKIEDQALSIEIISLVSGLIGILISIFFISRTYVLLPYLYVAILTTYLKIYCTDAYYETVELLSIIKLTGYSLAYIVFIYIFNRLATALML